ncbi:hypothetical protein BX592_112104 [Paraburkholderia rhizosphaerae]|uniref:Uncharacterized protein n=1 Tax=Paraburkholderia rhizosphaerae TaxID=480658 RepID=A0A4R8LNB3_9BURK|nr:hypothetical protein BX592_112104 [Paraburkholderia rhizosphaerae]
MRVLFVCAVVMAVFFGYMYATLLDSVAQSRDFADHIAMRYAR